MSVTPERTETTRRRDENKPTQLAYDTNSNRALIGELGLTCDGGLLQKGSIRLHQPPFGARSSVTERRAVRVFKLRYMRNDAHLYCALVIKQGLEGHFRDLGFAGIGNTISILTGSGI